MSASKKQGTALETDVVKEARMRGIRAQRIAEGGTRDRGDVELYTHAGRVIFECKARAALSLHDAWCKARAKADPGAVVGVVWKRLVRKGGNQRRTAAGPTLVAVPLDDYLDLLARIGDPRV